MYNHRHCRWQRTCCERCLVEETAKRIRAAIVCFVIGVVKELHPSSLFKTGWLKSMVKGVPGEGVRWPEKGR